MLKFIFYDIFNIIIAILCYVTNPIVLFFCDEHGELPGFLHYWQPWDDSCNPEYAVQCAPKCIQYDWPKHYTEHEDTTEALKKVGRKRWFTTCINYDFTIIERIKRYLCRLYWLTRNCSYGFSFWWFGISAKANDFVLLASKEDGLGGKMIYIRDFTKNKLLAPFKYKNDCRINSWLRWEIFLGWKIDESAEKPTQAMIANRFSIRFGKF